MTVTLKGGSGFNTEISGGNVHPCSQECYFDQDNGGGNDDCSWDHRCDPCTPVPSCQNDCGSCEICLGQPTLPEECEEQTCPPDSKPCGLPGDDPCPEGEYCITGCCVPTVVIE